MRPIAFVVCALILVTAAVSFSTAPALADTYSGTVTHVSTNNIKVKNSAGMELSFLLAPSFDQVFSTDGKTTYQMKDVKPGRHVKIVYHQQLGIRYADKIIFLSS
ncbi:MAG TPA: hypothetical protein VKF82_08570 [Candidatus Eremiobacteraceae bacterium]|nr:hypothetical protein [Candidatus Eremiobacteraceae bacterium]